MASVPAGAFGVVVVALVLSEFGEGSGGGVVVSVAAFGAVVLVLSEFGEGSSGGVVVSVAAFGAVVLVLSEFGDGAGGGAVVSAGAFGGVVVALVLSEFGDGGGVEVVVPGGVLDVAWGAVVVMVGAAPDGLAVAGGIVLTRVVGLTVGAVPVAAALDPEA